MRFSLSPAPRRLPDGPRRVTELDRPPPFWARAVAACVLCTSLVSQPLQALEPPPEPPVVAAPAAGSPVADEVWALIDKYYLDRTFNGQDWKATRARLAALQPLSEQDALDEAAKLVKGLGDRYSRVLTPLQAAKLNKYDVTGVGINLVISDAGDVKIGAVPPEGSDAAKLGVTFGDVVVSINGKSCVGMTSFDALEAIQGEGLTVRMEIRPAAGGQPREVVLTKTFLTKNPVSKTVRARVPAHAACMVRDRRRCGAPHRL